MTPRPLIRTLLSARQLEALRIINERGEITGPQLVRRLNGAKGSYQGVHQTAASLVRRRLITRERRHGVVVYAVTDAGKWAAEL